jgi:hypothetical protein
MLANWIRMQRTSCLVDVDQAAVRDAHAGRGQALYMVVEDAPLLRLLHLCFVSVVEVLKPAGAARGC